MNRLITLHPEPDFPHGDLSDDNADLLELMLANHEVMQAGHQASEAVSFFYQVTHRDFGRLALRLIDDDDKLAALSYGQAAWEALAGLVRPIDKTDGYHNGLEVNFHILAAHQQVAADFIDQADQARLDLEDQAPRVAAVVRSGANRLHPYNQSYALSGAGLARQAELSLYES